MFSATFLLNDLHRALQVLSRILLEQFGHENVRHYLCNLCFKYRRDGDAY